MTKIWPVSSQRRYAGAAVVLLALLSTSCGSFASKAATGGTFRVATTEPVSLDPVLASQPAAARVVRQLFDGLVRYDDTTAAVIPDMALSWDVSAGNTRFTFHLRKGAKFSDGEPVTAASFVAGMTRALLPALHGAPGSLGPELDGIVGAAAVTDGTSATLAGAQALDDRTLAISLSSPDAEFLIRCAGLAFVPVPSAATIAAQRPGWGEAPVGNGPFMLQPRPGGGGAWVHGRSITLVPNPGHGGGVPKLGEVAFEIEPSVDAAYAAWQAGQVDWAPVPSSDTTVVMALGKQDHVLRLSAQLDYLVVTGTALPAVPAAAAQMRQAISMAIDRASLASSIFAGQAAPATGIVPALIPGSASNGGARPCGACAFDPAGARALLVASGARVSGTVPVFYLPGTGQDAWMQAVARDLSANLGWAAVASPTAALPAAGSRVPAFPGPATAAISILAVSRSMGAPVPDDILQPLLGTQGTENLSGYANPTFDASLARARTLDDAGDRAAAYQQAERLAIADLPVVPVLWERQLRVVRVNQWSLLGMDAFGDPTLRTVVPRA